MSKSRRAAGGTVRLDDPTLPAAFTISATISAGHYQPQASPQAQESWSSSGKAGKISEISG
jgi:hypothetical protein